MISKYWDFYIFRLQFLPTVCYLAFISFLYILYVLFLATVAYHQLENEVIKIMMSILTYDAIGIVKMSYITIDKS